MKFLAQRKNKGFTLIETLVAAAVFAVVAVAAYKAYGSLIELVRASQARIAGLNLANEQFEIARNLPYEDVGIINGSPAGKIPRTQNLSRSNITFVVTTTVRNVDLPFDGTIGGNPNDTSPADNKIVEVEVACATCTNFQPITLTTRVAPKNLETASTNGALFIKVFDANGVPVPQAEVTVYNGTTDPPLTISDLTDNNGMLQLVDVPPGLEVYEITVTKDGYSTDQTYSPTQQNPNPIKRHATVLVQQVTQISFIIGQISTLNFTSVTPSCTPVGNIDFTMLGGKLIGEIPDESQVHKNLLTLATNSSGNLSVTDIEWDSYALELTDTVYDLIGVNPLNMITVNPGSDIDVQMVVAAKNARGLLVAVKDNGTALPLSGARVEITGPETFTKTTGQGFITQTDWSGGSGQVDMGHAARFANHDGNIDASNPDGEIKLSRVFDEYVSTAWLESSTFDVGAPSNFQKIIWQPEDQPVDAGEGSVTAQIATATTSTPASWTYRGPDGTSGTYYSFPNESINAVHTDDQYVRYKLFFSTASTTFTPNISDVSLTYTTNCTPPGQVYFGGLDAGTYTVTVTRNGYSTTTTLVEIQDSWTEEEVLLSPAI